MQHSAAKSDLLSFVMLLDQLHRRVFYGRCDAQECFGCEAKRGGRLMLNEPHRKYMPGPRTSALWLIG